ncbi:flavodoxin FldA [Buchnera aphidicola (Mollitrichosiphum nigrofasciatum)]|uniref:flavodoxin FldA n=1 Tax=Buchnera aphidicola TaxID=9 RepID=UPI0031B8AF0E
MNNKKNIGIFFGSDTGNTEFVAKLIQKTLYPKQSLLYEINNTKKKDIESCKILFFGISTWYYGDMQCDWEDFLPILQTINFHNKKIALFGCGDQEDYSEYFCDAMGLLYKILKSKKVEIIGQWSTKGYYHTSSKAEIKKNVFCGLTIDIDRQPKLTKLRVKKWIKNLRI